MLCGVTNGKPAGLEDIYDCTVCALANASGLDYSVCHIIMEQTGRKQNGFANMMFGLEEWRRERFGTFERISTHQDHFSSQRNMTVAQFVKKHSSGRFIIRIGSLFGTSHVMAVVDGVLIDNGHCEPARYRVLSAWELEINPD